VIEDEFVQQLTTLAIGRDAEKEAEEK